MSLVQSKKAARSLTIRAAGVAVVASILPAFGIKIAPETLPALENVVTGVAAAIAIFGRIRAKTLIERS
jgi:uncharacterized membrane protein (DUF441 family)